MQTSDTETSIELNFAVLKFKHTINEEKQMRKICVITSTRAEYGLLRRIMQRSKDDLVE